MHNKGNLRLSVGMRLKDATRGVELAAIRHRNASGGPAIPVPEPRMSPPPDSVARMGIPSGGNA